MCVQKQRASLYHLDIISCHSAPQHLVPFRLRVCKTRTGPGPHGFSLHIQLGSAPAGPSHLQSDSRSSRATPRRRHARVDGRSCAGLQKIDNVCPIAKSPAKKKTGDHTENATTLPRARSTALRLFSQLCQPFRPCGPSPVTTCIRAGSGGIVAVLARAPRRSPVHNWYGWLDLTTPRGSPSMLGLTRGALLDVRRLCR